MSVGSFFRMVNLNRVAKTSAFFPLYTAEPGLPAFVIGALVLPHHPLHFRYLHQYRAWDASFLKWTIRGSPRKAGLKPRVVRSVGSRRLRLALLLSLAERGYDGTGCAARSRKAAEDQLRSVLALCRQKSEVRLGQRDGSRPEVWLRIPPNGTAVGLEQTLYATGKSDLYGFLEMLLQPPLVTASFEDLKKETDRLVDVLIERASNAPLSRLGKRETALELLRRQRGLRSSYEDAWKWEEKALNLQDVD